MATGNHKGELCHTELLLLPRLSSATPLSSTSALSNARRRRTTDQGQAFSRVPVARKGIAEAQPDNPTAEYPLLVQRR